MQFEILKRLSPQGIAFGDENRPFNELLEKISLEFDEIKKTVLQASQEAPGALELTIDHWASYLELDPTEKDRGKKIASIFVATGGCTPRYIKSVAEKVSGKEIQIIEKEDSFDVVGIRLCKTFEMTCTSPVTKPLRKFERDETAISTIERIKHAHLDTRYYNKKRMVHAQD